MNWVAAIHFRYSDVVRATRRPLGEDDRSDPVCRANDAHNVYSTGAENGYMDFANMHTFASPDLAPRVRSAAPSPSRFCCAVSTLAALTEPRVKQVAESLRLAKRIRFQLAVEQKIGHGQYGKASLRSSRNSGRISGSFFGQLRPLDSSCYDTRLKHGLY